MVFYITTAAALLALPPALSKPVVLACTGRYGNMFFAIGWAATRNKPRHSTIPIHTPGGDHRL